MPLVVLYIVVIAATSFGIGRSDQARYIWYAENLAHGYFTRQDDVNLWSGPGYPLVLAPFAALKIPWAWARLLNVGFLFGVVIYLYYLLSCMLAKDLLRLEVSCWVSGHHFLPLSRAL